MLQRLVILVLIAATVSGCSVSLAGLTWADQKRERRAATVGPEELASFEPGQRVELGLLEGDVYEAKFEGLETDESGRVVVLDRAGAVERVDPDSIEWIRPRQKSYVIHALVFGTVVDILAIVLGSPNTVF
ncbi:MAG: hypothetical protein HKN17_07840 [Rhodothermales bacterium]|nr:hypothetical protein [Rhodothermales bacterium]